MHAPIGFDIGAVTPEEIAVSIVAELVAFRRGKLASRDASTDAAALQVPRHLKWTPPRRLG